MHRASCSKGLRSRQEKEFADERFCNDERRSDRDRAINIKQKKLSLQDPGRRLGNEEGNTRWERGGMKDG